jgi:hypothetical protein
MNCKKEKRVVGRWCTAQVHDRVASPPVMQSHEAHAKLLLHSNDLVRSAFPSIANALSVRCVMADSCRCFAFCDTHTRGVLFCFCCCLCS